MNKDTDRFSIENVSAWVLRIGVLLSVAVMVTGVVVSFVHGNGTIERMEQASYYGHPADTLQGLKAGRGKAIVELGILLLVLTPIMRVFMSMLLFLFHERDRLYALITLLVLAMTVGSLLWL